jgi:hypothetical protein
MMRARVSGVSFGLVLAGASLLAACGESPSAPALSPELDTRFSATERQVCADRGDWVWDGESWTLTGADDLGSRKYEMPDESDEKSVTISAPAGYAISGYCVKGGSQLIEELVSPASAMVTLALAADDRGRVPGVGQFSLSFTRLGDGQWCSPGYWRNHATNWPAGASPDDRYSVIVGAPAVEGNPTLGDVLRSPQTYGGDAFNAVSDYLSGLHPDVDFRGTRVEDSCPLGGPRAEI